LAAGFLLSDFKMCTSTTSMSTSTLLVIFTPVLPPLLFDKICLHRVNIHECISEFIVDLTIFDCDIMVEVDMTRIFLIGGSIWSIKHVVFKVSMPLCKLLSISCRYFSPTPLTLFIYFTVTIFLSTVCPSFLCQWKRGVGGITSSLLFLSIAVVLLSATSFIFESSRRVWSCWC
jgi:hypothetical protein